MSKVRLIFSLPEETSEMKDALHGSDYKIILHNIDVKLRDKQKHNSNPHWDSRTVNEIREFLWTELNDYGVKLYE